MPASSLLSPDTSCNSSPTASTRSSTDSKSALPLCKTPGRGGAGPGRHGAGWAHKQFNPGTATRVRAPDPSRPRDKRSHRGEAQQRPRPRPPLVFPTRLPLWPPQPADSVGLTGYVVEDLSVNFGKLAPQDFSASRHVTVRLPSAQSR